eukprot:TRINITY_DN2105_c0_g2_i1.p1 TRINITY_DN2105_c0_g2~~TRINITY_DN2105_c0_g2_i1.p1  ORF type:complete len:230 (+),score=75.08 TRINITY_DN2105_c0_g2_i1:64-753(+)
MPEYEQVPQEDLLVTPGLNNNQNEQQQQQQQPLQHQGLQPVLIMDGSNQPQIAYIAQDSVVQEDFNPQVTMEDVSQFQPQLAAENGPIYSTNVLYDTKWKILMSLSLSIVVICALFFLFSSFIFFLIFVLAGFAIYFFTPSKVEIFQNKIDIVIGFGLRYSTPIENVLDIQQVDSLCSPNYVFSLKFCTAFTNKVVIFRKNHYINNLVFNISEPENFIQIVRSLQQVEV